MNDHIGSQTLTNELWRNRENHPMIRAIVEFHERNGVAYGGAHDLLHVITVSALTEKIGAAEPEDIRKLAVYESWLHNIDRVLAVEAMRRVEAVDVENRMREFLALERNLSDTEKDTTLVSALNHNKRNSGDDHRSQILLADSDKVANLGLAAALRCGQHYNTLPTMDPRFVTTTDPKATYRNVRTVLYDVGAALEWDKRANTPFSIRTDAAQAMALPYFEWLMEGFILEQRRMDTLGVDLTDLLSNYDALYK